MPLRAPSELSDSLYVFVSSFGLDEDDDVPSPSLTLLFILQMFEFSVVNIFILFFLFVGL